MSAPVTGWLADAKFGNYRVFRAGAVLLFMSMAIICLLLVLEELVWEGIQELKWMNLCLTGSIFIVGACACFVTALPLGLDQMPDASSSSITSYIAWFVCANVFGSFLFQLLGTFGKRLNESFSSFYLVLSFISTICMGVVLVCNFFFTPNWLIIEPKSSQSLKIIYYVIKFAVKHKAPINRSALTYWEEDIPSRIDLGKSKYGGPFTNEQVENVKTVLRLLAISSPLFFVTLSFSFRTFTFNPSLIEANSSDVHSSNSNVIDYFAHNYSLYAIVSTLVFEFIVHPLALNKLPSILKRIGAVPLILTIVNFICLFSLTLAHYLSNSTEITGWVVDVFHSSTSGVLSQVLLTSVFEFMCAQSPYNMRGMLVSFFLPLALLSYIIAWRIGDILKHSDNLKVCFIQPYAWCSVISYSVNTVACFIGFLLFCVVAHWYKMRVRDDNYSPQQVVEEVYDRYLTAAAQSPQHGTSNQYIH